MGGRYCQWAGSRPESFVMKILIIEDDREIRNTLQDLLEVHGHAVLAADDGVEGIRLANTVPDLILCDIAMPAKGGYEVIRIIRELPQCREIPFIFLTARANRADQRYGMALGADDYITKPFTERDILDAIAARVRRQQPFRERVEQLVAERRAMVSAPWSHELMTPLCGILAGIELIEAETGTATIKPAELKKLLGAIRDGAERQHALSRKLVIYYELECLKAEQPKAFRCNDAAAVLTAGAIRAAKEEHRSDDLIMRCDDGAVPLSEAHFLAAVAELAGNAFRFSKPGQPVSVTGVRQGARYQVEIADQGSGMTADQRMKVDAFRQFERNIREQQGLGIGLALVRSAAELAKGEFRLQTGSGGRGLKAILDLPSLS